MLRKCLVLFALAALLAAPAWAQSAVATGIGPRVGFSSSPDQIVFGGQLIIGEIAPSLTFDPSLELGFGDDQTTIAPNFDLHYHFDIQGTTWRPYVGGGMSIVFTQFDNNPPERDDSETDVGGNFIIGAGVPTSAGNRFFSEMKFGLGDVPSFKWMVGWNFKL